VREKKKSYEDTINKLLGTNIRFSKLSLEELEALAAALADPTKWADFPKKSPYEMIAEGVRELAQTWDGPVLRRLRELLQLSQMEKEK
jgi:hypothetical protein